MAEELGLHLQPEEVAEIQTLLVRTTGAVTDMAGLLGTFGLLRFLPANTMQELEASLYAVTKIVDPEVYENAKTEREKIIRAMGGVPSDV